jgi:hypothetical protein
MDRRPSDTSHPSGKPHKALMKAARSPPVGIGLIPRSSGEARRSMVVRKKPGQEMALWVIFYGKH